VSERHAAHPLLGELEELIASSESAPRSERLINFARVLLGRTLRERLRTFDLEELYRQIVARDPREGPRIVEVHKTMIGMLDRMIEEQASRRSRRQRA